MADTVIDTLSVKIAANAQTASAALKSLTKALRQIKTEITGWKDGLPVTQSLSRSFGDLNRSLNSINTSSVKKLQKLSNAMMSYVEAARAMNKLGNVSVSGARKKSGVKEYEYTEKDFQSVGMSLKDSTAVSSGSTKKVDATSEAYRKLGDEAKRATTEVNKTGEAVKKAGQKAKQATGFFSKFVKSISRILLYRAIRTALKEISEGFSEGLKNAYYFSKQTGDLSKLARTLDSIASKTKQMKNQLGAFLGELLQAVKPILDTIVNKVIEVANYLTELFAALNGDLYWKHALYVAESWDDATDSIKEYKHQLLGLDELNNLTKEKDKSKDTAKDALDDFEYLDVSDKFRQIAWKWNSIKEKVSEYFNDWRFTLLGSLALVVLGTVLVMATGHWALGLGMILASSYYAGKQIALHWNEIKGVLDQYMNEYWYLFAIGSIGLTVLGAALLFTGHYGLGIGCILAGVTIGATTVAMAWETMYSDIEHAMQEYRWLFALGAIGLTVVGAGLLFTGHYATGLACILGGIALGVTEISMSWELLYEDVKNAFQQFAPLFALAGLGSMVAGILLLFTGKLPIGLALLFFGGFLTATTIGFNWDAILDNLTKVWENIKSWWHSTVVVGIKKAIGWIEEKFQIDINGDGILGYVEDKIPSNKKYESNLARSVRQGYIELEPYIFGAEHPGLSNIPVSVPNNSSSKSNTKTLNGINTNILPSSDLVIIKPGSAADVIESTLKEASSTIKNSPSNKSTSTHTGSTTTNGISGLAESIRNQTIQLEPYIFGAEHPDLIKKKKAMGGVVNGSLFWAGEQGAEFVGNIGTTSAVANTGQMTDAIYKAAYMGMSKALKENGGGGMNGYEPATMDDLFIAMRKKSNEYNMTKGASAFA